MSVQSLVPRAEGPLSPRATTTEQHPHPRPQLEKAPVLQRAPSPPPHTHAQRGRRGWPSPSAPRNNKGTHSRARLWPRGGAGQARLSAEVTKCTRSRARLCGPVDSGLPSSSDREIFQARILARISIPYCGGSSQRRECTCTQCVSCPAGVFFTAQAPEKRRKGRTALDQWHLALCSDTCISSSKQLDEVHFYPRFTDEDPGVQSDFPDVTWLLSSSLRFKHGSVYCRRRLGVHCILT